MKFPIRPVGEIEIAGIKKIVENREYIWLRHPGDTTKDGRVRQARWLRYSFSKKGVIGKEPQVGYSEARMHSKILHAMFRSADKVWVSCDTINIEEGVRPRRRKTKGKA